MDVRRVKLHDVAKKDCASRQRTWFLWIGRNTVGGENVKNRLPKGPSPVRPCEVAPPFKTGVGKHGSGWTSSPSAWASRQAQGPELNRRARAKGKPRPLAGESSGSLHFDLRSPNSAILYRIPKNCNSKRIKYLLTISSLFHRIPPKCVSLLNDHGFCLSSQR